MKKTGIKKMIIKILCICLCLAAAVVVANIIGNEANIKKTVEYITTLDTVTPADDVTVEKDADGFYTIITDRDLKIVQLTDIHIGGGWMSKNSDRLAINAVASMITEENPDLVIVTGDISFPSPFRASTFNNQYASTIFAELMNHLGVYWTVTFGNHDAEGFNLYNREKMGDFYEDEKWEKCLFLKGDESIDGVGNSIIRVKNTDGVITQALFTIDSNDYPKKGGGYDNIHENQIEWYKTMCEKLNEENKSSGNVNSLVFMHIPPVEYQTAWNEFEENGYKDTENVKYYYGTLGENVCCPATDDLFFETILEMNSTKGIFVGHDHVNTFSMDYMGIRLTYGMSIDYVAYGGIEKKGTQRGCTVITVKPDGTFDCYPENYYQDKYENPQKEKVTMQQLNEEFN